jgi:hypothetical protein
MNINQIILDFRSNANFNVDDEVELFRKLAFAMVSNANAIFIDETHGKVAQVEFTSQINGLEHCEISDLLIVIRHAIRNQYRATFWQAKKEKHPRWPIFKDRGNFDFEAQFNQWELLSQRPRIHGIANFCPPADLLSGASSPSIGSFGVFYENRNDLEVNYSVAEMVSSAGISKHPRMVINGYLSKYLAWDREKLVRNDLESFLESINNFEIGAMIDPKSTSGRWLAGYIAGKCFANDLDSFIDEDFFDGHIDDVKMVPDKDGDGISILMIETK